MQRTTATLAVLTGLVCFASMAIAGPLTPPAGPVDSTYKTLDEVEPRIPLNQDTAPGGLTGVFRIEQPGGSYYLTGPLTVPNGKNGIEIAREGVTIDLNGYTIRGNFGSGHGIVIDNFWDGITIRNGNIRFMDGGGISGPVSRGQIENIKVLSCDGIGIDVGERMIVRDCIVNTCIAGGIKVDGNSIVERCIVSSTQNGIGIEADFACRIIDSNANFGVNGDGIVVAEECLITNSISRGNSGSGIVAGNETTIRDCVVANNSGNDGIQLGVFGSAIGCTVTDSSGIGISTVYGGSVIDCEVLRSRSHGIFLESSSRAIGNIVIESGVAVPGGFSGIVVFSGNTDCVIKDNEVINNDVNINIFGTGCTIVRNISRNSIGGLGISIGGGNFAGATVANPAAAGPWDNIHN